MKKILITAIIATWIAIYPDFCSALQWYNYQNLQYEEIKVEISDYSPYIPLNPSAQGLYQVYIKMGDTPSESAIKVLKIITQERK